MHFSHSIIGTDWPLKFSGSEGSDFTHYKSVEKCDSLLFGKESYFGWNLQ